MITKQDLEDYRFREIALEQQFAKLKMWKNKLTRLHTTYGSGRVAEKLGYVSDCHQLHEIVIIYAPYISTQTISFEKACYHTCSDGSTLCIYDKSLLNHNDSAGFLMCVG